MRKCPVRAKFWLSPAHLSVGGSFASGILRPSLAGRFTNQYLAVQSARSSCITSKALLLSWSTVPHRAEAGVVENVVIVDARGAHGLLVTVPADPRLGVDIAESRHAGGRRLQRKLTGPHVRLGGNTVAGCYFPVPLDLGRLGQRAVPFRIIIIDVAEPLIVEPAPPCVPEMNPSNINGLTNQGSEVHPRRIDAAVLIPATRVVVGLIPVDQW